MAKFQPGEAREWAQGSLRGVCGCIHPTFTADLSSVNEAAIRHDLALEAELGFSGALLVGECGTTTEEMLEIVDIAVDAAGDDLHLVYQASHGTLDETVAAVREAGERGVDLILLSYPLGFYPQSEGEVFEFTRRVAESTHAGIVLFAMNLWNFARLHPAAFSPSLLDRLVDECGNIVAIKNEVGGPGVGGIGEVFERFNDRVIVTDPLEMNCPAWIPNYGMPWMGTSNYEYMGSAVPRYFPLLHDPETFDEGMEIYWSMAPARSANEAVVGTAINGTSLVPRLLWKYEGWLNGFNGGPIRSPHARINDGQMAALRRGAEDSGLSVTPLEDREFFVGRNPK